MLNKNISWPSAICSLLILSVAANFSTGKAHAAEPLKSGVDKPGFDMKANPADNFFQYVNGEWIKHNPIPPEYSRWGSFPKLMDDSLVAQGEILADLTKQKGELDPDRRKLRDFYISAMDEKALEAQGSKPLAEELAKIAGMKTRDDLVAELARLRAKGQPMVFTFYVAQDEKQSDHYAAHLRQGGLGLPERSYYSDETEKMKTIREQYRKHVAKILTLLGDSPDTAAAGAEAVMKIETKLAEESQAPQEMRDREKQYNKKTIAELSALAPRVDWNKYFAAVDVKNLPEVIVGQPKFLERVNELLDTISIDDWKTYLRWHLAHSMAPYLSSPFVDENFAFYGKTLSGAEKLQPRWKRATSTIDGEMGEALGRLYVEKYFKPEAKRRMDELVKNLMAAYRERIESRTWMGEETKKQALAKLATVVPKIGYPDKWRDYTALEITPDSYAGNVMRASEFESRYDLAKLGKPVDRGEWHMTPPTVNAYYNSTLNEIVFPAGILQPPFFDPLADDAVNYGGIGAVIGHEITHGFDDQGSRSDAQGNLKNWWTDKDRDQFTAKTDKLVKQYEECVAVDDLRINGKLTLGENIADLGGVAIAYDAYQKSLGGKPAPVIDGFTGPQRFFIGFAQVWRGSIKDAEQRRRLLVDPHSPAKFRTMIPLSNIPAFYEAFDVKPGQKMYRAPEDRVEVW